MDYLDLTEAHDYLFQIPEIEAMILQYLNKLTDYKQLILVNKYFHQIINNDPIFLNLKKFSVDSPTSVSFRMSRNRNGRNYHERIFLRACYFGYYETAKYFLLTYADKINEDFCIKIGFNDACFTNHFDIAKWLFSLNDKIKISTKNYSAFSMACQSGNLERAINLYQFHKNNQHNYNITFQLTCLFGHLDVAKWLYSLNNRIDITDNNDIAFKNCIQFYPLSPEIIKWLCSIHDEYKAEFDEDGKIRSAYILRNGQIIFQKNFNR